MSERCQDFSTASGSIPVGSIRMDYGILPTPERVDAWVRPPPAGTPFAQLPRPARFVGSADVGNGLYHQVVCGTGMKPPSR